ncbi:S8 family serine peptidase [Lutibacter sp. TH_r2]|uniref:S8 family serine peptidase n=1 Tax=Lutibacter sp. TH_r2 TaxID=3082083 RepID=UPI0029538946|nr:S8 family serine peptidase [Lutibacter sp. TH_r2]MDV7188205.1 S8 family serine peptidase [Lutibacter sp. TH_r2]
MKVKLLIFLSLFSIFSINAQEDAWVYFVDKPNGANQIAAPLTILTQRALDRRTKQSIPLDIKDAPLEANYVAAVANATGITVLARSKWLNALHIQGSKTDIDNLIDLEFPIGTKIVSSIEFADRSIADTKNRIAKTQKVSKWDKIGKIKALPNYGNATNQIEILNGNVLHENNFTGEDMYIAVMDGGFPGVKTYEAFSNVYNSGRILGGYDFVNRNDEYDAGISHGMSVLSTMAGFLESDGEGTSTIDYIGTAPDASYYLFITEDGNNEVRLEESLWVEATERADSLGVDVINTSLGYSIFFDNIDHNYEYSDMDGQTTFISRGAEVAFSRGMILVTSAGNEGNDSSWPYINAPADAENTLTIGAVDSSGTIAGFSSYGPTSDFRVKPDVCSQGLGSYVVNGSTSVGSGSGTSYASPIMAGAVACLWQAFPTKTNAEIVQLIKESAHLYNNPNNHEGYGIPDFESIYNKVLSVPNEELVKQFTVYPNPVKDQLFIKFPNNYEEVKVTVYNVLGKMQLQQVVKKESPSLNIAHFSKGLYMVSLSNGDVKTSFKIFKN